MRSALLAMVLGLLLLLATPAASAHAAGSPPITQSGVIELAPVTNNFTLLAPPPDLTVFVVFPIILGVIVLLLWVARKRPHRPWPKESRLQKKDALGPAPVSDGTRTDQPSDRPRRT